MNIIIRGLDITQRRINGIPKQTKFAASRTINDCLIAAQKNTTEKLLPQQYTVRSDWHRPGRRYGFNARFAKASNLEGRMGTRADWMEFHEEGGIKSPTKARNLSIPEEARVNEMRPIPRRLKPKALLEKRGFVIRTKEGLSILATRDRKSKQIHVMYIFKPQADIKATFRFVPENTKLVLGMWERRFTENFRKAMATAK